MLSPHHATQPPFHAMSRQEKNRS